MAKKRGRPPKNSTQNPVGSNGGGQQNNMPVLKNSNNHRHQQNNTPAPNYRPNYGGHQYNTHERNEFYRRTGVKWEYVLRVRELIEQCLIQYINRDQVVKRLRDVNRVEPWLTIKVWNMMEKSNPELFQHYYTRVALSHQISNFNRLLQQHAESAEMLHRVSLGSHAELIASNYLTVPLYGNNISGGLSPVVHTNGNTSNDPGNPKSVGDITRSHNISLVGMDTSEGSVGNGILRSSEKVLHLPALPSNTLAVPLDGNNMIVGPPPAVYTNSTMSDYPSNPKSVDDITGSHNISLAGMDTSERPTCNGILRNSEEVIQLPALPSNTLIVPLDEDNMLGGPPPAIHSNDDTSDNRSNPESVSYITGSHNISLADIDTSEEPTGNGILSSFEEVLQLKALPSNTLTVQLDGNNISGGPPPVIHTNDDTLDDPSNPESIGSIFGSYNILLADDDMDTKGPAGNGILRSSEDVLHLSALPSKDSSATDQLFDYRPDFVDADFSCSLSDVILGSPNFGIDYDSPLREWDSF